jgi:hypothetical protein
MDSRKDIWELLLDLILLRLVHGIQQTAHRLPAPWDLVRYVRVMLTCELLKECIAKERKRNLGVDQKSQA